MNSGPIVLVDDDVEDKEILQQILTDLNVHNPLLWLDNCADSMQYLRTTQKQAFLIICDINLPKQNGIDFKKDLDNDPVLRKKSIPFVFCSTSVSEETVNRAYMEMTVQGFFQKCFSYEEFRKNMKTIIDYWMICTHPNVV